MKAVVDPQKCLQLACPKCPAARRCDVRALVHLEVDSSAVVQETNCNGCGDCLPACPAGAISLE